jgi:L-proline amide hydrolase
MTALRAPISAEEPDEQVQRNLFFTRHVCRLEPTPEDVVRAFELVGANPGVFAAMMGPAGDGTGTLHGWTATPRLAQISVPTLVLAGEHDELQPVAWRPLAEQIPGALAHVFAGASHMPYLESPHEYHATVAPFLTEHDGISPG